MPNLLFTSSTGVELALLGLAFALSAVIGVERQRKLKSAGLRTHTLVGLGSAVFTLVSAYGFDAVLASDVIVDPSRIAAQVVSGVGFLGAGVIFVRKNAVSGLTTAASIWVTAAVGMACGAGMPVLAVAATALHLVTVGLLTILGRHLRPAPPSTLLVVRYERGRGLLRSVLTVAGDSGYPASLVSRDGVATVGRSRKDEREISILLGGRADEMSPLISSIAGMPGVLSVRAGGDDDD